MDHAKTSKYHMTCIVLHSISLRILMKIKIERLRCDEDYKCYDRTLFLYSMQLKAKRERNKQKKHALSMNLSY